jgi:hypothetical protein
MEKKMNQQWKKRYFTRKKRYFTSLSTHSHLAVDAGLPAEVPCVDVLDDRLVEGRDQIIGRSAEVDALRGALDGDGRGRGGEGDGGGDEFHFDKRKKIAK